MKIVVGLDPAAEGQSSSQSRNAKTLEAALQLVKGADDEVVLAVVIPWRYPTNPLKGSDSRELEKKASEVLQKYEQVLQDKNIKVKTALLKFAGEGAKDVGAELCSLAEREEANAIVIGSRGYGKLAYWLLGSTAKYVVANAKCEVLVVK